MWRHVLIFLPLVVAALEIGGYLIGPVGRGVCFGLIIFGFTAILKWCSIPSLPKILRSALISLGGALATFLLANHLHWGTLVASAVVALVGARFFNDDDQLVLYLGTFVGMSSLTRFPTFFPLIVAGLLGGVLWEVLE